MGDENSLQGQTRAHKHTAPSSDGSFLSAGITGMTNLSNGSMVYGDVAEIVTELSAGGVGDALKISAGGIPEWSASAGATVTVQNASIANGSTTSSGVLVDVPGSSITLPNRVGGYAFLSACFVFNNSVANANIKLAIYNGGSATAVQVLRCYDASNEHSVSVTAMQPLDGSVVKCQYAINSSYTATVINISTNTSTFQSFEVS
jgi:hypothetical protein